MAGAAHPDTFPIVVGANQAVAMPWARMVSVAPALQMNHGRTLAELSEAGGVTAAELFRAAWRMRPGAPINVTPQQLGDFLVSFAGGGGG